ncbi:GNAT family N-acetyltransferase [Halosimplex pelagicum]|uniref:GNAT family N-acetyltransferase n=1 Tax=Halosimplex pelagicum TaxID=869886 RepID=A0A7D5P921_9EURY|nr:GNAT family protein [Halosimplex pelagicum]QLH80785.1 GNAT family N-acetyltransferase [Halosimplex pelagicum]
MSTPVFLRGDGVSLHPVEESDHEFLRRNLNRPDVRAGFGAATVLDEDGVAGYVEGYTDADDKEIFLVRAGGDRVGEAFLFDLAPQRGSVELGYWIAPAHQGNGYATAAAAAVVDYCFTERRLHKVNARVLAFNDGSRAVLEKVGFEREGCRRDDFYVDGEYVDADLYGIVEDEWDGPSSAAGAPADGPGEGD